MYMYRAALWAFAGLASASSSNKPAQWPLSPDRSTHAEHNDADLSILAGIHTIYSMPGSVAKPPKELLDLVRAGLVGGIILSAENMGNPRATSRGLSAIQNAYLESPAADLIRSLTGIGYARLLVMTAQEGGHVRTIKDWGPEDSAKTTGLAPHVDAAAGEAGSQAALALNMHGHNVNLAPVLDVFSDEGNFIDEFDRSYSSTPDKVSEAGVAFVKGMRNSGVGAVAKHFPGLGRAPRGANTDLVPVTLNVTEDELNKVDIAPFVDAIAADVHMIMPSWATYPFVDAKRPAGLSSVWLKEKLRKELGFKGVTISDAISAGAVKPFGKPAEVAVLAAGAGMDLLVANGRGIKQGVEVRQALEEAVISGKLDRAEFDAATERIIRLRADLSAA
ncbi:hypothetical protein ACJ41O_012971 [Fusarium nematophilum]